jgi:hypothetical protein
MTFFRWLWRAIRRQRPNTSLALYGLASTITPRETRK